MSHAQTAPLVDTPRPAANVTSPNVLPLRSPRATLQVYLTGRAPDAHLSQLLQSPLGVYVTHTEILRDGVKVYLDIAPEDFAFTLHALMNAVPEATIGSVSRRIDAKVR